MSKRYEIRLPHRSHPQIIFILLILIFNVTTNLSLGNPSYLISLLSWVISIIVLFIIVLQAILFTRFGDEIEITDNNIKAKNIELPLKEIEKITIEGYFRQSIGIKRKGRRFVPTNLHFRFKKDEEKQVKEWERWAEDNGIKVVKGTVYSWI